MLSDTPADAKVCDAENVFYGQEVSFDEASLAEESK